MATLETLDQELRKRLHAREMQAARYGIAADPAITIEAETLRNAVHVLGLVRINRRNLGYLLQQQALHAGTTPVAILNQIASARQTIAERTREFNRVARDLGLQLDEEAAPTPQVAPAPSAPYHADKLRQIVQLTQLEPSRDVLALIRRLASELLSET